MFILYIAAKNVPIVLWNK